jgi:7-carboxy-7-deazaguanine synthase (Cx14CxxC type)
MSAVYVVKEIFYSLQGEGAYTGRPAVFCRFAGCNLWNGRETDRAAADCRFCDTDFVGTEGTGGGRFARATDLAGAIASLWPEDAGGSHRFVVLTGGEPLLQVDEALIDELHDRGFEIAVETNGTRLPPAGVDWICVSPKANAPLRLTWGNELKLVYPQPGAEPELFTSLAFAHFFLQPMDGPERERNTRLAIEYCLANPRWRLSLQTHKITGIK